jgi:hypothetical protein
MTLKWKQEVTHCRILIGLTQGVSAFPAEMTCSDSGTSLSQWSLKAIVLPVAQPIMRRLRYRETAFVLLFL